MIAPFDSVALDPTTYDAFADVNGDIAIQTGAAAVAQDMASACALFRGEYIFDITIGVPYRTIFGQTISLAVLKSDFVNAAATIPGLVANSVVCFIQSVADRNVKGQVQGKLPNATTPVAAAIGPQPSPQPGLVLTSEDGRILVTPTGTVLTP